MANSPFDYLSDILAAPLGELISSIGHGVGEAQAALDAGSLAQTLAIYNSTDNDEMRKQLKEIGYQPTFYVLPETEVEAQISLSIAMNNVDQSSGQSTPAKTRMYASPINAGNTNRYNLNVGAYAKIKFKIVPIPPPSNVSDMPIVPVIIGKNLTDAINILTQYGLGYKTKHGETAGTVTNSTPPAGNKVKMGDVVELEV